MFQIILTDLISVSEFF